jgi:hypothetical protein
MNSLISSNIDKFYGIFIIFDTIFFFNVCYPTIVVFFKLGLLSLNFRHNFVENTPVSKAPPTLTNIILNIRTMIKKVIVSTAILFMLGFLASCGGERPIEPEDEYLFLHEGNFWIYQNVEINKDGKERILPEQDSIIITNKTVIGNETYYQLYWNSNYSNVRIDSLKRLVDEYDHIIVDTKKFDTTYRTDTLYTGPTNTDLLAIFNYSMVKNIDANVPAGEFKRCISVKGKVDLFPPYNQLMKVRYTESIYAPKVGKVLDKYWGDPNSAATKERRLLRYKIYN